MEQPSGLTSWRASFQRRYLSNLVAALRRGRIERATGVTARSRAVKLAADLSLAMTARGRTAWSRGINGKYLLRRNKSHCQRRVFKSRRNFHVKRRLVSAKTKPRKQNGACRNPAMRLPVTESRPMENEEAEGTVASRMQTLRALVPGGRSLDTPVFLTEAADYIVALKMQVHTMQALAHKYSNSIADSACQVKASHGVGSRVDNQG